MTALHPVPEVDALGLTLAEITDGLRAWATGSHPTLAAVELLAAHGSWLRRSEVRGLLWVEDDVVGFDHYELAALALIVPGSSSELAVLHLVVGLLGIESPEPLSSLLIGLDHHNLALVLDAIACCAGWAEKGRSHVVTGRPHRGTGR